MRIHQPTPELPVRDVIEAQHHYRDCLGFEIAWHHEHGRIGAVVHGECAIFFRERAGEWEPCVLWVFAYEVDAAEAELRALGADIVDPIADRPWGLRQFTVRDLNGHILHFHHDLD